MNPLIIVGAGGHAREVAQLVADINQAQPGQWNLLGFVADLQAANRQPKALPAPLLGDFTCLARHPQAQLVVAIGTRPNRLLTKGGDLKTTSWGGLVVNEESGETSKQGVYAGGDAVTGAATVILAAGAGLRAAARRLPFGPLSQPAYPHFGSDADRPHGCARAGAE